MLFQHRVTSFERLYVMLSTQKMECITRQFENSSLPQYAKLKALLHAIGLLCLEYTRLVKAKSDLVHHRYNIGTKPRDMEHTYTDGRTSERNGGCFGSRTTECVNSRNGLDSSHPAKIKLDGTIAAYHEFRKLYISDYATLELWAIALSNARDIALTEEPSSPECRELLSVLLVSVPHDRWNGLSDYHHSWNDSNNTGWHGEFLNRYNPSILNRLVSGVTPENYKRKKGGRRARTLVEGRDLVDHVYRTSFGTRKKPVRPTTFNSLHPDNKATTIIGRLNNIFHSSQESYGPRNTFIESQNDKYDFGAAILNDCYTKRDLLLFGKYSLNGDRGLDADDLFRMLCYVKRNPDCMKYSRLASVQSTGGPSVPTLITSRPIAIGHLIVYGVQVPLYIAECKTARTLVTQIVLYPGKTVVEDASTILHELDWLHENHPKCDLADINAEHFIDRYQRRLDNNIARLERQRITKLNRRQSTAHYARRILKIGCMKLNDSRAAGNCWPGTEQFAQSLGIELPITWDEKFEVDSRTIVRAWRKNNYIANNLFYAAIEMSEARVKLESVTSNQERIELAPCL